MDRVKKIGSRIKIPAVVVFAAILCGSLTGYWNFVIPIPYRSLSPFQGKVIDADTKETISEAVVLAAYYLTSFSVAGGISSIVDGQENVTDEKGEFRLSRKRSWFVLLRGYPEGTLVIFKPGYGVFPNHKRSEAVGVNKSWPPPNKYIVYEIPKLKTNSERRSNLPGAFSFKEISYEKQKTYIDAINEERKNLGLNPYPVPQKEIQK